MGPRVGLDGRNISSPPDSLSVRPARSQSLNRLSYPVHRCLGLQVKSQLKKILEISPHIFKDCAFAGNKRFEVFTRRLEASVMLHYCG